jgi:hypothetical protein
VRPYPETKKKKSQKSAGFVAQGEGLSSNPSTGKKKRRRRRKGNTFNF